MLLSKEPQVPLVPAEMEESTAKLRGLMLFLVLVTKVTTAQEEQSTKITIVHLLEPLELEDFVQKETFDQQDQLLWLHALPETIVLKIILLQFLHLVLKDIIVVEEHQLKDQLATQLIKEIFVQQEIIVQQAQLQVLLAQQEHINLTKEPQHHLNV